MLTRLAGAWNSLTGDLLRFRHTFEFVSFQMKSCKCLSQKREHKFGGIEQFNLYLPDKIKADSDCNYENISWTMNSPDCITSAFSFTLSPVSFHYFRPFIPGQGGSRLSTGTKTFFSPLTLLQEIKSRPDTVYEQSSMFWLYNPASWTCSEHHHQMFRPPQLTPFNVKEWGGVEWDIQGGVEEDNIIINAVR